MKRQWKPKQDGIRKRSGSSLQTLMYSSVYSLFRNLARKAQCTGRASGNKGKKGREVLHWSNGYIVETKPSAKGSPAPERWPEDDAYSWPSFWCSVVLLLVENKNESSGVGMFLCVWEETNNKQNHQRAAAAWARASYDRVDLRGSAPLWAEQRLQAWSSAKSRKLL